MNILILDRDRHAAAPLFTQLEEMGHNVVLESVRKTAIDLIHNEQFDVIFIDPAPLPSVREITLPLRWEQRDDYFYLILAGHDYGDEEVLHSGMNDKISKDYNPEDLKQGLIRAERLIRFMKRLRHSNTNHTDNQAFGQRAFYQLMLSALDRAYRYNEQAFLLMMQMTNYDTLVSKLGQATTDQILEELGLYLSKMHRMSDYLGHTETTEYAMLILRPTANTEPHDAADRFRTALEDFQSRITTPVKPEFNIELWALPSADLKMSSKI